MSENGIRINKYLSEAGVCSRREADRLVDAGRVCIDGVTAVSGAKVCDGQTVTLDGRNIKKEEEEKSIESNKWMFYAILSAVFASLTSILGKIGISGIESNLGTAIRTIVVLIMAWIVVFVTKKQGDIKNIDKKSWVFIGLSGITTGLSWLCYYKALQDGEASVVVPIDKLSILVTVAFSYVFLKEKLNKKSFIGLIMIVIGTLILLV